MAIRRLRETLVCHNSDYQLLDIQECSAHIRESFETLKTRRMRESVDEGKMFRELERLAESNPSLAPYVKRIKESGAATVPKLWKFPVARFGNMNGNKRIYLRELWENVIQNQRDIWQGGVGLCDHPKDDDDPGEMKYASIVWLDMLIDDVNNLIWAIGSFVGTYGRLAQEIIEAGGRVGFSSSGFGDCLSDNCTVDPVNYLIERTADLVLNPSQGVFGDSTSENTGGNIEYIPATTQSRVKESAGKSRIIANKKEPTMTVNVIDQNQPAGVPLQEATQTAPRLSRLEERVWRKSVESFVSDARNIDNPTARLKEMADILTMFREGHAPDLREKLEEALVTEQENLEKLVESAVALQKEFGADDLEAFRESAKNLAMEATIIRDENTDYQKLVEGLTARNAELVKRVHLLETKLNIKNKFSERKEMAHNRVIVAGESQLDSLRESNAAMAKELSQLKATVRKLSESNTILEKENGTVKTRLTEATRKVETFANAANKGAETSSAAKQEIKSLKEDKASLTAQVARLQEKHANLLKEAGALRREYMEYKATVARESLPEAHVIPKFNERVSGSLNLREGKGTEIEAYWGDLFKRYREGIIPYERHIRGAKTLREAQGAFMKYRQFIDADFGAADEARLTEGHIPQTARKKILESSGMVFEDNAKTSHAELNDRFLLQAKRMGLGG